MRSLSTRSLMTINREEERVWNKKYGLHLRKMEQIQSQHKSSAKKFKDEQSKFAEALRRSKEISRRFKMDEELSRRIYQDRKMIDNLIDIHTRPSIRSEFKKLKIRLDTLPERSLSKQRIYQQSKISTENMRLGLSIVQSASGIKKYKKKMRSEIDQYIKTRNNLQKMKPVKVNTQQK